MTPAATIGFSNNVKMFEGKKKSIMLAIRTCSQFEYHLRAGLDLPLPKVELVKRGFAMINLLGEGKGEIRLSHSTQGKLHWYGKNENRLGRKLGHINVMDSSPQKALKRALQWRKEFQL